MPTAIGMAQRIARTSAALTPTERRIAEMVLDDPTALAFGTVADVARMADTSGPTVVRFATKLGFDSYGSMQEVARQTVAAQLRRPTERIRQPAPDDRWAWHHQQAMAAVTAVFTETGHDDVSAAADVIANAPGQVWVLGAETASVPSLAAAWGIRQLRPGVRHISGFSAAADEVIDGGPDDVGLVVDFPRYEQAVLDAATSLRDSGAHLIAVTDSAFSPLAGMADRWFPVHVNAVGPFDSALPALALIETLVAEVAGQLRGVATERLDWIEERRIRRGVYIGGDRP